MDKITTQIAAEWIAKYDAAVKAEDLEAMQQIIETVCASPNIPFRKEVMRQLEI